MTKRSEPKVTLNITPGKLTPALLKKWNKVWTRLLSQAMESQKHEDIFPKK